MTSSRAGADDALMAALVADDFFLYICRSVGIKECAILQERCLQVVMQKHRRPFQGCRTCAAYRSGFGY